jgi:CheY-like chemotaxis protein
VLVSASTESGKVVLGADVVVMDVRMPVMNGIEATRIITGLADAPRVLVITTFDIDEYVYDSLRAAMVGGASDAMRRRPSLFQPRQTLYRRLGVPQHR